MSRRVWADTSLAPASLAEALGGATCSPISLNALVPCDGALGSTQLAARLLPPAAWLTLLLEEGGAHFPRESGTWRQNQEEWGRERRRSEPCGTTSSVETGLGCGGLFCFPCTGRLRNQRRDVRGGRVSWTQIRLG